MTCDVMSLTFTVQICSLGHTKGDQIWCDSNQALWLTSCGHEHDGPVEETKHFRKWGKKMHNSHLLGRRSQILCVRCCCVSGVDWFSLAHLFGIPVFRYCSILASILANEVFLVTFPEQASTETRKYPGCEKGMVTSFTWQAAGNQRVQFNPIHKFTLWMRWSVRTGALTVMKELLSPFCCSLLLRDLTCVWR